MRSGKYVVYRKAKLLLCHQPRSWQGRYSMLSLALDSCQSLFVASFRGRSNELDVAQLFALQSCRYDDPRRWSWQLQQKWNRAKSSSRSTRSCSTIPKRSRILRWMLTEWACLTPLLASLDWGLLPQGAVSSCDSTCRRVFQRCIHSRRSLRMYDAMRIVLEAIPYASN